MLIGLYGGTFDPVHLGHTHAATVVRERLGLVEVRMVLAARPGHRGEPVAHDTHRWNMLKLACAEHEGLTPDDTELNRPGASYTFTTVTELREREPNVVPCWIMGQDAFATLPIWHRWRELLAHCNLIVVDRPGDRREEPAAVRALCDAHERATLAPDEVGQIVRLEADMLEVSATEIRRFVGQRSSYQHLLADPVCTYISDHNLYLES